MVRLEETRELLARFLGLQRLSSRICDSVIQKSRLLSHLCIGANGRYADNPPAYTGVHLVELVSATSTSASVDGTVVSPAGQRRRRPGKTKERSAVFVNRDLIMYVLEARKVVGMPHKAEGGAVDAPQQRGGVGFGHFRRFSASPWCESSRTPTQGSPSTTLPVPTPDPDPLGANSLVRFMIPDRQDYESFVERNCHDFVVLSPVIMDELTGYPVLIGAHREHSRYPDLISPSAGSPLHRWSVGVARISSPATSSPLPTSSTTPDLLTTAETAKRLLETRDAATAISLILGPAYSGSRAVVNPAMVVKIREPTRTCLPEPDSVKRNGVRFGKACVSTIVTLNAIISGRGGPQTVGHYVELEVLAPVREIVRRFDARAFD
ncbi:hypothetical protein BJ742DRAFT_880169 [Cladochytrium replicatum]|nr:hypothetical protein BJ742DRAFT_880169 [Cladochytrium replicatum]